MTHALLWGNIKKDVSIFNCLEEQWDTAVLTDILGFVRLDAMDNLTDRESTLCYKKWCKKLYMYSLLYYFHIDISQWIIYSAVVSQKSLQKEIIKKYGTCYFSIFAI